MTGKKKKSKTNSNHMMGLLKHVHEVGRLDYLWRSASPLPLRISDESLVWMN
jgi:hypothetical protein